MCSYWICDGCRPLGSEPKKVSNFIEEYIKNTMDRKQIQNPFQEDEPDAPDNTVSLKIVKGTKIVSGKLKKITKKIRIRTKILKKPMKFLRD